MSNEIPQVEHKCTEYQEYDDTGRRCQCPVCGGWITWNKKTGEPECHNCNSELAKVPEIDEEAEDEKDREQSWGKICVLTPRPIDWSKRKENLSAKRQVKAGFRKWKAFL